MSRNDRTQHTSEWRNRVTAHGEEVPDQPLANPRNWRVHPRAQQDALAAVLDQVGWVQDVIVNQRTGHVVDGHARIALAISKQEPGIPVVYVDLDEDEERLILASLDPLSAMAATDHDAIRELLAEISVDDDALLAMFEKVSPGNRNGGNTDPDAVPDVPEQSTVQRGEVYVLGEHRLMCGDSTSPDDVARLMVGERATLLATDPPYLVDYQGGNHPQSWHNKPDVKDKHWDDYRDPDAASGFFTDFLRVWLAHSVEGVPVYQWHATRRQALVEDAWRKNGLLVHQTVIWVKARPSLTRSDYMWQHEPCFYGWPEGHRTRAEAARQRLDGLGDQSAGRAGRHPPHPEAGRDLRAADPVPHRPGRDLRRALLRQRHPDHRRRATGPPLLRDGD